MVTVRAALRRMDPTSGGAARSTAKGKSEWVLTELPVHPVNGLTTTSPSKQKLRAGVFCVGTVAAAACLPQWPGSVWVWARLSSCLRHPGPAPSPGAPTHQDVAVSFSEFSEGLGDLLPRFGLLEVAVHRAVFFLRRIQDGVSGGHGGPASERAALSPGLTPGGRRRS